VAPVGQINFLIRVDHASTPTSNAIVSVKTNAAIKNNMLCSLAGFAGGVPIHGRLGSRGDVCGCKPVNRTGNGWVRSSRARCA
jgi:hypothetical protein